MARHRRLIVPGVALHVRQRGVDGMACFREETDRLVYLSALRELIGKARCALHAYCLMTNHVHLLVTPTDEKGCSIFMRELGRRYVPYFNNRYGRTGTLWGGRFRSCLVESREYVLACYATSSAIPCARAWWLRHRPIVGRASRRIPGKQTIEPCADTQSTRRLDSTRRRGGLHTVVFA